MKVLAFKKEHVSEACQLFIDSFNQQRVLVPILPGSMADPDLVKEKLNKLIIEDRDVVAVSNGKVAGYLGAFQVEAFRRINRKAAYIPVWAHASIKTGSRRDIYNEMYRSASENWTATGCQMHAISVLAYDSDLIQTWFWSGFGLSVVDAIRPIHPFCTGISKEFEIRKAKFDDIPELVILDGEHLQHYARAPVYMVPQKPDDAPAFQKFLCSGSNSVWTAWHGHALAGYMKFEDSSFGASEIVESENTIAITGAFVRPAFRRRRIAEALLNAGLSDYADQGFLRCSVDFESFNIEAAGFWPHYFTPICLSMFRVPEILS